LQAGFMADWVGAPFSVGLGALISLGYGLFVAIRVPEIRHGDRSPAFFVVNND
jgi:hypothetical protein